MRSNVTCADRALDRLTLNATCIARDKVIGTIVKTTRCIDVPPNECRAEPVDIYTGKPLKRKFTVKKENVKEKWW